MDGIITIGEYVQQLQPIIFRSLYQRFKLYTKDITEQVLAAAYISGEDKQYAYVMQERPRPGRGGLMWGEGDEDL